LLGLLSTSEVARRFVDRINAHDVEGLVALMTGDHVFVDSLGNRSPRPEIESGWGHYFKMVPDYWVRIDKTISDGDTAILLGEAGGTYTAEHRVAKPEDMWHTPAVWVARVVGTKVAEWRIYADNEPIRARMRE
jgi:ketosteroid isomerase-like protein